MNSLNVLAFVSLLVLTAGCILNRPPRYVERPVFREDLVPPQYAVTTPPPAAPPVVVQDQSDMDQQLATSIRHEVGRYGELSGYLPNINIAADRGRVTLTGSVPGTRERELIDTLVRNTPGVVTVDNLLRVTDPRVELQPTGRDTATGSGEWSDSFFNLHVQGLTDQDRDLAQQILTGLRTDSALASNVPRVNIHVSDGQVTLRGIVQNEQQRQTIENTVRGATGVADVKNELMVQQTPR